MVGREQGRAGAGGDPGLGVHRPDVLVACLRGDPELASRLLGGMPRATFASPGIRCQANLRAACASALSRRACRGQQFTGGRRVRVQGRGDDFQHGSHDGRTRENSLSTSSATSARSLTILIMSRTCCSDPERAAARDARCLARRSFVSRISSSGQVSCPRQAYIASRPRRGTVPSGAARQPRAAAHPGARVAAGRAAGNPGHSPSRDGPSRLPVKPMPGFPAPGNPVTSTGPVVPG